ncbi:MAG: hypothetical protein WBI17_10130 [Clostridiaceae bacterium]
MKEYRHHSKFPIILVFLGVFLSVILLKSKMMYVEGKEEGFECCGEDMDRIRHFGCCKSSKDFDAEKEER